jgi:hypothetical protein
VTAGLGVPRTLTWNGSSTAPDTPPGVATATITSPAANAVASAHAPLITWPNLLTAGHSRMVTVPARVMS